MIATIHNEHFGYAVACEGNWAAVGNPAIIRYSPLTSSWLRTGSVEVYRYNINTDTHDLKTTLSRPRTDAEDVFLAINTASLAELILHTEFTGSVPVTADLDLLLDVGQYYTASEDGYGRSLDIHDNILVVGNPYFSSSLTIDTASITVIGNGNVDLFDLTRLDVDPYLVRQQPVIVGYGISSSLLAIEASVPASQSFGYVLLETSESGSAYQKTSLIVTSNAGGTVILNTSYATASSDLAFRVSGIVSTDPYFLTLDNPNTAVSNSFGWDVSRNSNWLAVSSIYESGSKGAVFMYQRVSENEASWSLYQVISPPGDILAGDYFGWAVDLNKSPGAASGSMAAFSGSMVIGTFKTSQSRAYVYEFTNSSWTQSFTLYPKYDDVQPLTFFPTLPYFSGSVVNTADNFGYDVAIYGNTVVVGAPSDRFIYEYTGSSLYHQGAAYFFERCENTSRGYYLARKSYGNEKILKDNRLGWAVSVNENYAVVGCPKYLFNPSICYLRGTLYQQHYCGDPDDVINGQYVLFNKITGSIPDTTNLDWEILNVYQTKKRLLQPHRSYGYATDLCDNFIIIGAPMLVSGSNRIMDFAPDTASFTGSVYDLGDLSGKAYIYNLRNFRESFYVGNVFYRNGKLVVMTSGSAFDGILQTDVTDDEYQYKMDFKSKQVVFEKQIVCPIEPGEFNVSTNPTALTISQSSYDLNHNGKFDFQDADILLRYMAYKATEASGVPNPDWSSSIIGTQTDEETTVYAMYSSSWIGTEALFTSSFSSINNTLFRELDFNEDNKIDENDMNILWKYFIYRLTQQNYETYVTPNSQKKYLSDIIDFLDGRTLRGHPPHIHHNFLDYEALSKADPTGSYLASYVTSVGLYSGTELVAVAKLGSPIKITPDFPINIVVKMDY
jgi:hypothetical protein